MRRPTISALVLLMACGSANAFEFRCRFVERVGNQDVVISNNHLNAVPSVTRNVRIQMGVFDDAAGPAPAGGFVGWNVGTLTVSGPVNNSTERRNPGRIAPFTFSQQPNANGNPPAPAGDPFTMLTDIDATLGTQSPVWVCTPGGTVPPRPAPVVRGINTFISVFAFSVQAGFENYTVTAGGNLFAAELWQEVGLPLFPDCGDPLDPSDDIAGNVTYAPIVTTPQSFSCVLSVTIPSPGAVAPLTLAALIARCRRRP